ncbi:restriction endonuclease subunit S [Sulfitobacter sp. 20_GPM-1509m]|uniref:restriction endonuclease subunit S n=1 Tax=Sulfitobacter sp. 20_GPM-1509m TaxID=1380367 RepID=UPI00048D51E7|nr:restriction endonuclease subunit S [Sulfitobacter sp. 20_GPM-1509m]
MKDGVATTWREVNLADVCDKMQTIDPRKSPEKSFNYIDVSSVSNLTYTIEATQELTGNEAPSRARRLVSKDDIIFATIRPTLMRIAQVPKHLDGEVCSTGYIVLKPSKLIEPRFLFYALFRPEFMDQMAELQSGASYPAVTDKQVLQHKIPLPPLEEQKRIVTKLDQAFTALNRARGHAEANLADAEELYRATIGQLFEDRASWHSEDLNKRVRFIDYRGKTPPKRETGVRLITAKNVRMGYIKKEPREFILESAYDDWMTRGFPQMGDVLFTTEAPLANVAELDTAEKVVIGQRLITMQTDSNEILPRFLKWSLLSPQMQQDIRDKGTGATVTGIKASLLKKIPLHIPPSFDDQDVISEKCEAAFALRDELTAQYETKLADLADLRQSLLQKAFSGRLT